MPVLRALAVLPAAAGLAAVIAVAGCQSSSAPHAATASQTASSTAPAPASSASTAPAASGPGSASAPAASVSPSASASASPSAAGFQNLAATAAVKAELQTAFATAKRVPARDVAGSTAGSVYYGYDPATATYWAEADYRLETRVPESVQVGFQDGSSTGFFKKTAGGAWQVTVAHEPVNCGEVAFFPKAVLTAWNLPPSPAPSC